MEPELRESVFSVTDGVATFVMNRPDVMNALTPAIREDLHDIIRHVRRTPTIRVLVITGEGKSFSVGGDVKAMKERQEAMAGSPDAWHESAETSRQRILDAHEWLEALYNLDRPVVAAVNGPAFGAGFSLALLCDFILAAPDARFCTAFGRMGLLPDMGMLYTLPRMVGVQHAKELAMTARVVEPDEARSLGLVHSIIREEPFREAAVRFAGRFLHASQSSLSMTKTMLNRAFSMDYREMAEYEAAGQALCFASRYHREAANRFVDRQPPLYNWDALAKNG
ncbi:MAG: enoyl-CoA hydratase/isomerase family protein [Ectothiorhodospiraceae bacterium]|nr:enoyl-CoA hydratase/isomerase family protein [Ectothiorhodospiraceae bacterium]MCH8506604.1 enoyl-CoA hydratase/isomerase family protein [Ectothiorhodospiraceae bacterium]